MTRLHLVDGTYELFRAHFTKRPSHLDATGRERKAVVGLVSSLLALLHDEAEAVTHLAIAFDRPIRSFRNTLFADYKTEEGVDPELLAQMEPAEEAARAIGVTVWVMDTYEADDALATAASRFAPEVEQVRILTPDKDLLQCVRDERVVRVDRQRGKVTGEAELRAARGFGPQSVPDFLALVGDTADGIPGIPGFGEVGAAALLARYAKLEAIPGDGAAWEVPVRGAGKLAAVLRSRWADALLYRRLATLAENVPLHLEHGLDSLAFRGVPHGRFQALCAALASETLRERPQRWAIDD